LDPADVRGLLGLLLADGNLVPYRTPGGGFVQLTLTAGVSESAFLEEKVAEFRQFLPTKAEIVPYGCTLRDNGKRTLALRFRVSSAKLFPIYNLLYPGRQRRITSTALEMLGAQAAAWLWAEGARIGADGDVELARVGSGKEEAELVRDWLGMLTGAQAHLNLSRVRPRLSLDAEQAGKIRSALEPYAPSSRRHLFQPKVWDVSVIRSTRTELQHRLRQAETEGSAQAAMA
jgi:hypothetical protein